MTKDYLDLDGNLISTGELDDEERRFVARLRGRARAERDWGTFDNYWMQALDRLYGRRGLNAAQIERTAVYRIAEDLSGRLGVELGLARVPDYRDELEEVIRTRFKTRKAFCVAAGLSETMVSHVLARRKHIAIDTLAEALSRIGYELRLVPSEKMTQKRKAGRVIAAAR